MSTNVTSTRRIILETLGEHMAKHELPFMTQFADDLIEKLRLPAFTPNEPAE